MIEFTIDILGAWLGYLVYEANPRSFQINPVGYTLTGTVLTVATFLFATGVAFFTTRPWVIVSITPEAITVGSMRFDRDHYSGMRIGYTVEDKDGLKNDFFDLSMGLAGLRLAYGRWGEDLPYLVNKYHSAEIVIWMNEIISHVGASPQRDHAPELGRIKQIF